MKLTIKHQDSYSRGELLLRTFFGGFYILIPHGFLLFFILIASAFLNFLTFWAILFTGKFPKGFFDFQLKLVNWSTRLTATIYNLVDGYPAFGLNGKSDSVSVNVEYPETSSRGKLILRLFALIYVMIPHGFCLYFRMIATGFILFLAWWVVLFTGKYPESWHGFNVGTLRWATRIGFYMNCLTDQYPAFSGKE